MLSSFSWSRKISFASVCGVASQNFPTFKFACFSGQLARIFGTFNFVVSIYFVKQNHFDSTFSLPAHICFICVLGVKKLNFFRYDLMVHEQKV